MFENRGDDIKRRAIALSAQLQQAGLDLSLTFGADIQLVPELLTGLQSGSMPTLGGSRYFLFEPPHHTVPAYFHQLIFDVLAAGYVPVITHPERLTWLDEEHYPWFVEAARDGAWIQITAGALVGRFGRQPRYWSERFLGDGLVHLLATDAHDPSRRPPLLSEGRLAAEPWVGSAEALRLVLDRPASILEDRAPHAVAPPPGLAEDSPPQSGEGWLKRLFGGVSRRRSGRRGPGSGAGCAIA